MKKNIIIIVLALVTVVFAAMNINAYKEKEELIYRDKINLKSELAGALTSLNTEREQSYNEAMTHFYAADKLISRSEAVPQEGKRVAVCGFLCQYGIRYPEVFKKYIPELTALHEKVIALDINSGGQTGFDKTFMELYSELNEIVGKIGEGIS